MVQSVIGYHRSDLHIDIKAPISLNSEKLHFTDKMFSMYNMHLQSRFFTKDSTKCDNREF